MIIILYPWVVDFPEYFHREEETGLLPKELLVYNLHLDVDRNQGHAFLTYLLDRPVKSKPFVSK